MSDHGLNRTYIAGCRCAPCREAHTRYEATRRMHIRDGHERLVGATRARNHLRRLAQSGVGKRSASDAADVTYRSINLIRSGKQKRISRRLEAAILSLTEDAAANRSLVNRAPVDRVIQGLLIEGFTKARIAREMGYKTSKLQLFGRVQARTKMKFQKFYNRVMAEEALLAGRLRVGLDELLAGGTATNAASRQSE